MHDVCSAVDKRRTLCCNCLISTLLQHPASRSVSADAETRADDVTSGLRDCRVLPV